MKLISYAAAALVLMVNVAAAQFGPLVSPVELNASLGANAPVILDIRAPAAAEGQENVNTYSAGHIPGAINAPYGRFRGPADNPGALPSAETLTTLFRELGLRQGQSVVIAHQGANETDFGAAARVYWTLKSAGFENLSILNGGVAAWQEAGLALSTETTAATPSMITVALSDQWTATPEQIQTVISGESNGLLLDARPESFWNGDQSHPAAARPGTLPQSQYFVHSSWFDNGPAIVDAEAARALADAQGFSEAETLVSFCNTGHWAATNWFALSELAGIENVKLYPESMVGWSNAGYDMANVPGPIRNLWNQIKSVF
ncbi:rhodanese-like domain-containing protein [Rhodobacteraceae bacterium XHP0102]|nr:rhodanese-like domain-containing protein [Rhodobacteraceae bacterium XHP0102]